MDNNKIAIIKNQNKWVFTKWDPISAEGLHACKAFILWEKSIENPKALTREEKDWIARQFNSCTYFPHSSVICVGGWALKFPTVKKYLVNFKDDRSSWYEYYAFDKMSLRHALLNVKHIMEFPPE